MSQVRRSVAGIALSGKLLFVAQRKAGGSLGGKWEFPGGKVEEGESDEAALKREYLEEFGADITTGALLADSSFEHKGETFLLRAYRISFAKGNEPDDLRLLEHEKWRWASLEEIEKFDFADSDRALFPALKTHLEQETVVEY